MAFDPGDDTLDTFEDAVDALSAIYSALQVCETGSPHHAVTAAEVIINNADYHAAEAIGEHHGPALATSPPGLEAQVIAHSIMLRATTFLTATLETLRGAPVSPATVGVLKRLASAA